MQYAGVLACEEAGGALPAVLALIAVVTTLAGAVMAVHLVQHRFIRQDVHRLQADYAAEAGLHEALVRLEANPEWRADGTVASCAEAHACRVWAEAYGGFVRLTAEARVRDQTSRRRAFAAQVPVGHFDNAMVLGDDPADLTLSGSTRVTGPVALGRGRVVKERLQGEPFTGHFEGEVREDQPWIAYAARLPRETMQVQREHLEHPPEDALAIEEMRKGNGMEERQESEDGYRAQNLQPVYAEGNLVITGEDDALGEQPIQLLVAGNLKLEGAVRLYPGTQLVARDTLWISGAVMGPQSLLVGGQAVFVEGWDEGSAQVLAGRRITVQGGVHLTYPSLLYVEGWVDASDEMQHRYGGPTRTGNVEVRDGARIDGTVLYPPAPASETAVKANLGTIVLADDAEVHGALYSSGRIELAGTVHGSVLTREFYFYRSPTHYVNWIDGGDVDVTRRPPGFLTPIGFGGYEDEMPLDLIYLADDSPPDTF